MDIKKQAERINWDGYNAEAAALDAICFQTTDGQWRHKIMSQKMSLQDAIDYGRTSVHTEVKNKKLGEVTSHTNGNGDREETVGKLATRRGGGKGNQGNGGGQQKPSEDACKKCEYTQHMSG